MQEEAGKEEEMERPHAGEDKGEAVLPTPYSLLPTPYTPHPTPYTIHPTPYTLHLHPRQYPSGAPTGAQPLQGSLAHTQQPPPRTLRYRQGPTVVVGGTADSHERGTPISPA